jgi:hypothetical protein
MPLLRRCDLRKRLHTGRIPARLGAIPGRLNEPRPNKAGLRSLRGRGFPRLPETRAGV